MTPAARPAWPADGARLLEPSVSYALGVVLAVTPEILPRPTPCQVVDIAGCPLAARVMAAAAALEVAVHGWDISRACGQREPIPRALAIDLLAIAPVLVPRIGRHPLFAAPVAVAATAGPSDRLAAFLGRSPA